ncbi:hypothetical protein DUNSADRAFT_10023 [Dunaliella salina]|uniref:MYND-type domain-containing protein n=1 Tax=Dunaliella salina TaxID=3046 RepID=A0ABQ7GGB9_DUNSA|nr:hypothetical protein DUNSADRAFT_10023 [Dunaliella salina]|eukprot:KAF5833607.1 hypothetical protein DUNSADRAFT_10023 [Dunaliella salina]
MPDKLQAMTLGDGGQEGSSSSGQSAGAGSRGVVERGEAVRKERVCGHCGMQARDLKRCSQCRQKWFCGVACSSKACPAHRAECKAAAKLKK